MAGPFDTSHLRAFFFREVDDDATAAAFEVALTEKRPIEDVKTVHVVRCRIKYAGDPKTETVFNAHDPFQFFRAPNQRHGQWFTCAEFFPDQYALFEQGLEQIQDGIPLEELTAFLSAAKIEELKGLDIVTCEALANLEGSRLQKLGVGGRALQMKAKAYLAQSKSNEATADLQKEVRELKRQLAALTPAATPAAPLAAAAPAAKPSAEMGDDPPANLKGAARTAWIKKQAAAKAGQVKAAEQQQASPATPSPTSDAGVRAMLEAMDEVDLRNMLSEYGKVPKTGSSKKELVDLMVEVNANAERGLKATEAA